MLSHRLTCTYVHPVNAPVQLSTAMLIHHATEESQATLLAGTSSTAILGNKSLAAPRRLSAQGYTDADVQNTPSPPRAPEGKQGRRRRLLGLVTDSAGRGQGQEETGTSQDLPLSCPAPTSTPPGGLAWKRWGGEERLPGEARPGPLLSAGPLPRPHAPLSWQCFPFRSGCGAWA